VHLTPERQTRLSQIAVQAGTNIVVRYLDEEARFLAAVEKGLAAAERGRSCQRFKLLE
jgi:predicted transcriptional regulator